MKKFRGCTRKQLEVYRTQIKHLAFPKGVLSTLLYTRRKPYLVKIKPCCEGWVDEEILISVPWNSRKINAHLTRHIYCFWHAVIILGWHSLSIFKDSESLKAPEIGSNYTRFNPITNTTVSPFTVTLGSHSTCTIEKFIYLIFDCF